MMYSTDLECFVGLTLNSINLLDSFTFSIVKSYPYPDYFSIFLIPSTFYCIISKKNKQNTVVDI